MQVLGHVQSHDAVSRPVVIVPNLEALKTVAYFKRSLAWVDELISIGEFRKKGKKELSIICKCIQLTRFKDIYYIKISSNDNIPLALS